LAYGFVKQDDAADVIRGAFGPEKQLSVVAAVLLRGLRVDGVKASFDCPTALIRSQDALLQRDHCLGCSVQLLYVHCCLLPDEEPLPAKPDSLV
jgi:hypothetical protein